MSLNRTHIRPESEYTCRYLFEVVFYSTTLFGFLLVSNLIYPRFHSNFQNRKVEPVQTVSTFSNKLLY
jgi:hypothetical protein